MFDILIRNALIVDGTGGDPFEGSIAIRDGRIAEVGAHVCHAAAKREIDAHGRLVAPGWVDIHCHYDAQVRWDPLLSPSSASGVTTLVGGNCGVGFAPCRAQQREFLIELMEGVEDIPGEALAAGIDWDWETFPEYLDCLASRRYASDLAMLVSHGAVRAYCLGEERTRLADRAGGPYNVQVTDEELARMAAVVREAVAAGAVGFSTNRYTGHRDKHGTLVPGTLGQADEMVALARAVAEGGGGVVEMACDFSTYDDLPRDQMDADLLAERGRSEWAWIQHVARNFKVPVSLNMAVGNGPNDSASCYSFFNTASQCAKDGMQIVGQVMVRPQGILAAVDSSLMHFTSSPTYQSLKQSLHPDALRAEFCRPETRAKILGEVRAQLKDKNFMKSREGAVLWWMNDNAFWWEWQEGYEPRPEESVAAIAKASGRGPLEVVYDILSKDGGQGILWRCLQNYGQGNLELSRFMLEHPQSVPGISDAGAHCSIMQDASASTHMLTHWVRDRTRGPRLEIQRAVKLQTHDTARLYGFADRGTLEPGMLADLNIIDMDKLRIHKPRHVYDLPRGAARWVQDVSGYVLTMKTGIVTFENGHPTGELPGQLLRNAGNLGHPAQSLHLDAPFNDVLKAKLAARATEHLAKDSAAVSAEEAIDRTLKNGTTGTTEISRMARAAEDHKSSVSSKL